MADLNNDPNARYDSGPNVAGAGRLSIQSVLNTLGTDTTLGLQDDGTVNNAPLRAGQHVAGAVRNNVGPNVAGSPRSVNGT